MPQFVKNLQDLAAPSGVVITMHSHPDTGIKKIKRRAGVESLNGTDVGNAGSRTGVKSTDISDEMRQQKMHVVNVLLPAVESIKMSTQDKADLHEFKKQLNNGTYDEINNPSTPGIVAHVMKLIEFALKAPLESLSEKRRKAIVGELLDTLFENSYQFNMPIGVQIALREDAPEAMKKMVEASAKNAARRLERGLEESKVEGLTTLKVRFSTGMGATR